MRILQCNIKLKIMLTLILSTYSIQLETPSITVIQLQPPNIIPGYEGSDV